MFFKRKIWNDGAPFEDFMGRDGAPPVARRHLAYGGGKGGSGGTTYQTQKTEIPPEVRARYDAINARAEQVAQQPFTPYGGQFVAPLTATQQQGIQQIGQAGQSYQPYQQAATTALTGGAEAGLPFYGQAAGNIAQAQGAGQPYTGLATQAGLAGTQAIAPQALNIGAYQNPYIQSVVDPTMAALRQQQQMEQSQLMGQQAMRGAFGGDRGSIAAANLARQQGLASAQTEAGLRSQGFQQAQQTAQQQQGVGLGAAQANRAALQQFSPQALAIGQQAFQQPMAAAQAQQQLGQGLLGYGQNVAQGLSGLGQQGAQLGLATGQAQLGAGTLEQQTQQQLNSAFYNQFQQQQGYPFQVAQFLANIGMGTGPLYGSTTTGVTGQPTPFFSDERVKEDIVEIGRTHDGQKIIKFKYKGSDQPQIGLSAQDVEKHHPEAVSETAGGIKAVDYDAATKQAERAYGGGLMPSSEGGAVHPSMAGLGFAAGGTPGVDDYSRELLQGMADPRHKTTPFGGGLPGGKQSWRVAPTQPAQILGSGVQLKPPAQRPTGLSEVMGGVKDAVSAVETGEKVYKGGEKAYDWAKGAVNDIRDKLELPGLVANAASNVAGGAPGLMHGGRAGYALDGSVADDETPAIPGGGDDTVLGGLTKQQVTPAKLPEHKLDMSAGAGGDKKKKDPAMSGLTGAASGAMAGAPLGPWGMAGGAVIGGLAGAFSKDGGRVGYAEGGGQTFVDRLMPAALKASEKTGVHPHLILAQAALESGWGKHAPGNNYFGIKGPGQVLDTKEQGATGLYNTRDSFRKYESPEHSVDDYANFIMSNSRYRPVREARTLDEQIDAMGRSGYATDRDYTAKLRGIANSLSGNATPFTPSERGRAPAEAHMRAEMPEPRHAGLAPKISVDDEEPMELVPDDDENFEMPDRFNRFASGGLVGRHGYQTDGTVVQAIDPDRVDPTDPAQAAILRAQQQRGAPAPRPTAPTGVVTPPAADPDRITTTPLAPPPTGVAPPPSDPPPKDRDFLDRAGDWYNSNQNWVLPLAGGIGKMLASRSPYFLNAAGEGLAEGSTVGAGCLPKAAGPRHQHDGSPWQASWRARVRHCAARWPRHVS